jgi:hypothetical protein
MAAKVTQVPARIRGFDAICPLDVGGSHGCRVIAGRRDEQILIVDPGVETSYIMLEWHGSPAKAA